MPFAFIRLLPAPIHIAALRIAHAVRQRWWRLVPSSARGVRVLVLNARGEVLLIRHSYGSGRWMHPGGGLGRREDPVAGAVREAREETGCRLDPALVLSHDRDRAYGHETWLVAGWTADAPQPDNREILDARFFAPGDPPEDVAATLAARLPALVREAEAARLRQGEGDPFPGR